MNSQQYIIHEIMDLVSVLQVLPLKDKHEQLELIKSTLLEYPSKVNTPISNYHISMARNYLDNGVFDAFNSSLELALSFID